MRKKETVDSELTKKDNIDIVKSENTILFNPNYLFQNTLNKLSDYLDGFIISDGVYNILFHLPSSFTTKINTEKEYSFSVETRNVSDELTNYVMVSSDKNIDAMFEYLTKIVQYNNKIEETKRIMEENFKKYQEELEKQIQSIVV